MEYVEGIRTFVADTFLTFPLIMIGFIFFLGVLTSNSGLLFLFFGHLFLVPSLEFVSNESGPAWFRDSKFNILKLLNWLFSVLLVLGVNANSLGGGDYYYLMLLSVIPFVGQFVYHSSEKEITPLFFFNPLAWFLPANTGSEARAAAKCSMVPNSSLEGNIYRTPSFWSAHLVFFMGFFFQNALTIYNEPAPKLTDPNSTEAQKASLETRVTNRKWISAGAIAMSLVIFTIFLIFRYGSTPCEGSFLYSLIPLILIAITGGAWFKIIYNTCGVKPADILGIAQGFLSPNNLDTPVVCIGSEDVTPAPACAPSPPITPQSLPTVANVSQNSSKKL